MNILIYICIYRVKLYCIRRLARLKNATADNSASADNDATVVTVTAVVARYFIKLNLILSAILKTNSKLLLLDRLLGICFGIQ